jgi:mRNA interferase MazF
MTTRNYVPDSGDVVWLEFNPPAGREQAGNRPALVVSPAGYNIKSGLMVCCPMSGTIKGHPFEVLITVDGEQNAILSDQVRSLDWRRQNAKKKVAVNPEVLAHVRAKIKALLVIK